MSSINLSSFCSVRRACTFSQKVIEKGGILVKQSPHITLGGVCSPVCLLAVKLGQAKSLHGQGQQSMVSLGSFQVQVSLYHPGYQHNVSQLV